MVVLRVQVIDDDGRHVGQLHCSLHPRFHLVHRLAQAHRTRHPRTALDRVQLAHQIARELAVVGIACQSAQVGRHRRQQLGGLCQKHFQQLGIELVTHARSCGLFWFYVGVGLIAVRVHTFSWYGPPLGKRRAGFLGGLRDEVFIRRRFLHW